MTLGAGESISIDKQNVEKLKEEIEKAIIKQADLSKLSKQIDITVTGEGLKIELIEGQGGTFFESGSPKLSESGVELLDMLSGQLKVLPNRLLIEGHTDAQPYSSDTGYTNWELSSDRANSARRLLQQGGIGANQISQVRGYADQMLRIPSNPLDPSNRRVSLIVQWADSAAADANPPLPPGETGAGESKTSGPQSSANPAANSVGSSTKPETTLPAAPAAPAKQTAATPATVSASSWTARMRALVPGKKK
jgi:chemotaxis protein MotB